MKKLWSSATMATNIYSSSKASSLFSCHAVSFQTQDGNMAVCAQQRPTLQTTRSRAVKKYASCVDDFFKDNVINLNVSPPKSSNKSCLRRDFWNFNIDVMGSIGARLEYGLLVVQILREMLAIVLNPGRTIRALLRRIRGG